MKNIFKIFLLMRYFFLSLCICREHSYSAEEHIMNYEKVQKYLKSLQAAGISNYDLNGYQNYINNAKLHRQRSMMNIPHHPHHHHHHHPTAAIPPYPVPIYATPPSISSGYLTNARLYTMPHSYQSNFYQDYYYTHDERRSPRDIEKRNERRKKSSADDTTLSYTGADRDLVRHLTSFFTFFNLLLPFSFFPTFLIRRIII